MRRQYEIIVWKDHWAGYDSPTEPGDIISGPKVLVSIGWRIREDRECVYLSTEQANEVNDTRVRHVQTILKKEIVSRQTRFVQLKLGA